MTLELCRISDLPGLRAIADEWTELARRSGAGSLFRGPSWLLPWWHAYQQVLHGEPCVLAGRDESGALACLAPLYARVARGGPGLKVREIRMMGDAGPRPPTLDFLAAPGQEDQAGTALARWLTEAAEDWDVLALEPLEDPSRVRAVLIGRLAAGGCTVTSHPAGGARRIALAVEGIDVAEAAGDDALIRTYTGDGAALRKGLSALKRLSRLEWADREEASPIANPEASQLLEEITLDPGSAFHARLARLDDSSGEAVALSLVVDDGDRAVVMALAVDPQHVERHAPARLLAAEARAAAARGRRALDVVTGASEHELPALPVTRQHALRVTVYGTTRTAAMARTYGAVRRRARAARIAPGTAAAGARAAWAKIRTAAASMARYERLHLYRGELWTRGVEPPSGLSLGLFSEAEFDALDDHARAEMVEALDLDEQYCRYKWQRGDVVVLARLHDRPAGITWCARRAVEVPELGLTLRLGPSEAYIHDVFVAPHARGRAVAPSMLEFLAHELRQRDVYRGWALIGSDNVASVRAFEKAAYAAVCDVIHAHIANVDRWIVRPPDPAARHMLGLS